MPGFFSSLGNAVKRYRATTAALVGTVGYDLINNMWYFTDIPLPDGDNNAGAKALALLTLVAFDAACWGTVGYAVDKLREAGIAAKGKAVTVTVVSSRIAFEFLNSMFVFTRMPLSTGANDNTSKAFYFLGLVAFNGLRWGVLGKGAEAVIEYASDPLTRPLRLGLPSSVL